MRVTYTIYYILHVKWRQAKAYVLRAAWNSSPDSIRLNTDTSVLPGIPYLTALGLTLTLIDFKIF